MYNNYYGYDYPNQINVTEKKAPTDASIKLLNEFEEKARSNITNTIRIKDTIVDAVGFEYFKAYNPASFNGQHFYDIRFKINGEEFHFKDEIPPDEIDHFQLKDKMVVQIAKAVSNAVTREVFKKLLTLQIY